MKVELRHIHKHFGAVHANNDISMVIPSGSIQGILGENGAGKSTLMKILTGFIQADEGEILLNDKPIKIETPSDSIRVGIGMLHQDPLDFPPMRVVDNLLIGQEGGIFPDRKSVIAEFKKLQAQFHFDIDPETYVDTLTVGERQQLEILRLLWLGAQVLILDEPTTGISAPQRIKLFETLRLLASQGKTIIFVSHKLEEVEVLCHRVAVFTSGRLVGTAEPPFVTDDLVKMMFGKPIKLAERTQTDFCDELVRIDHLCIEHSRLEMRNINFTARCGEVIGLAGMEGSGQLPFLRTLSGLTRSVGGKIHLRNQDLTGKPYKQYLDSRIYYVPASRLEEALIPGLSLTDHFILTGEQRGYFINRDRSVGVTEERIKEFNIRGVPENRIEALSGGNQQRALLALLPKNVDVLLVEHPTRGLDIESSIYIWSKLKDRCKTGTTIFFISSDLEEILRYSDRILVFFGGKVSQPLDASKTTVDQLGQLIGGKGF